MDSPLAQSDLEEKFDEILYAALSSRRSFAAVAIGISTLTRTQQEFVLSWAQITAQNVAEFGYQFAAQAPQAFSCSIRRAWRFRRRQTEGDDIDFDAAVEACADRAVGLEPSGRLFAKRRRVDRNIAVMFMADMSGSTKGWINECGREALGDRYAIYGFSGWTRKRCEIYRVKTFAEGYSEDVCARIAGVEPKDYTRMGFVIRHLAGRLNEVEERIRILFTLSDGKPDDFSDGYRGACGIEDTPQALNEACRSGIHPFCVTIDGEARDYLPHM